MIFATITESEFRKFADQSPYKSFMQTPEIAKLREKSGWTVYYFAVKEGDQILAATMAVAKPTFLGKSTFYTPGGPLVDYENTALLNFFIKNLKKYAKSHNGYILQIDPYYELIERDREGDIVEGGFNRTRALKSLESLGFRPMLHTSQPKYLFVMDINGRTPDELFASFKQNTRNLVSRTARNGIKVRELTRKELDIFKQITEATSERRHFNDRSLEYYQQMYDLFHKKGEVKFIVAEVDIDGKTTPLSAAMFMTYGDEVIYLFSGSDAKYMKEYNAQYAIQWYMIKYAAEHGYKKYNFYGIQGLPDPKAKDYGIYRFKKGFGGQVVELIGSFELPLNFFYYLHSILAKLRHH